MNRVSWINTTVLLHRWVLLIGDATAGVWDAATLTAGSNITITNADGAITIAASGGGGGTDELVKTSATDAVRFLEAKLTGGNNALVTINLDPISGEQNLVVSATDNKVAGTNGDLTPSCSIRRWWLEPESPWLSSMIPCWVIR